MGRLFTVRETAQILGLCQASVRHHLRSGQLQGARVGGSWRVSEKVLLAQLGLATLSGSAGAVEVEETENRPSKHAFTLANEPEEPASLQPETARRQMRDLVAQAAAHASLSKNTTQRLLAELDDLLEV